jgi:hypothetical protein
MFKIIKRTIIVLFITSLAGCAGSPSTIASSIVARNAAPAWVSNSSSVYEDSQYVSAVGFGPDRETSEQNAIRALTAIFGQSVQGETQTSYRYQEAVINGLLESQENRELDSIVKTSFALDTLIGAEIDNVWFDEQDTWYSVAVMERMKCSAIYRDLIESNLEVIQTLTASLTHEEKYSFAGYGKYNMAAVIADANAALINVLSVLNPARAVSYRTRARPGEEYRIEARQITQSIPVSVIINQDYSGRIKNVFSEVYANKGFQTGGEDAPYELQISAVLEETVLPANPNMFFRYTVNAKLIEKNRSQVLLPFSISGREGSVSLLEAENRTLRIIEQKVRESYADKLEEYLAGL